MAINLNYRPLLALLMFCCPVISMAQQNKVDSLRKLLPTLNSHKKIDCLNELSQVYWSMRLFDNAKQYALSAISESQKAGYPVGAGVAYHNLGNVDYEIGDFIGVVENSNQAIRFFNKVNAQKPLAKAYLLLGQGIWAQSKFDLAKEQFSKATQIFNQLHDPVDLANSYGLIAAEEEERGHYEESFQYCMKALGSYDEAAFIPLGQLYADVGDYETALDYYGRVRDRNMKIYVNLKVGETYYMAGKYDSAMYHYQLYIKDEGRLSPKLLSKPYALLGAVYLKLKDYNTALHYLNSALGDFAAENNRNWIMRVTLELGRTYQQMGELNLALSKGRELLSDAEQSGARQYTKDAHYLLFELNQALGNKAEAFQNLRQYTLLNNQISIDNSARKLAFYKSSHEREQAQLKIDLLNKQQQLQREELQQTSQQRKFLFIGILALILIGIVTVRNILLKKRNESHLRELAENELQIQRLETKKQLGELQMLALRTQMNPHFIFNSLNSINRFILQNNKAMASEYLTKFSRLVRMILQNSQSKLITLEQELESLELYLSLEALRFDNHFSYKIDIQPGLDASFLKVPPLIVQPYAENSVWHGLMHKEEKGQLDIDVFCENDLLYLKITDNGVGREKASALAGKAETGHKSMGLGITSQRIAMVQEADSQENPVTINDLVDEKGMPAGTEVIIKLPVIYD